MAGRFPRPLNPGILGQEWDALTRARLYELLQSLFKGMSGLQGTPEDPTDIEAGVDSDIGSGQAVALSNHTHHVLTAAPSAPVSFSQPASEGSSGSLLRSDARLRLEDGTSDGDILVWNGSNWVSQNRSILPWIL